MSNIVVVILIRIRCGRVGQYITKIEGRAEAIARYRLVIQPTDAGFLPDRWAGKKVVDQWRHLTGSQNPTGLTVVEHLQQARSRAAGIERHVDAIALIDCQDGRDRSRRFRRQQTDTIALTAARLPEQVSQLIGACFQLAVCHRRLIGDHRRSVGPTLGALGDVVLEKCFHRATAGSKARLNAEVWYSRSSRLGGMSRMKVL